MLELIGKIAYIIAIVSAVYMIVVSIAYLIQFLVAVGKVFRERDLHRELYHHDLEGNVRAFPVSIIVPCYNEEVGILNTVRSLIGLNYPEYEVIIVDDGSKDQTADIVINEYKMEEIRPAIRQHMETEAVHKVYRSTMFTNITLVIKSNGGKSDALNAGINISKYPYFCAIDADCILESDAMLKTMKPIILSNGEVVVTGGSVRIANGCKISHSKIEQIGLPKQPIAMMQVIEYLRGFLIGRLGLSRMNILLIISGAFGVFNKHTVIRAGGYQVNTMGEDMELIVRLHRMLKEERSNKKIEYIPDPVCWTEAPSSWRSLYRQRVRWQRGLAETLMLHKGMLFNPKYKSIGLFSLPYFLIVELLGCIFEALGYVVIICGLFFDFINLPIALFMICITILYGSLLTAFSILLEEWTFHKYPKVSHLFKLYFYALTESFWYRPFLIFARLIGLFTSFGKKKQWGDMRRKGVSENEAEAAS